MAQSAATKVEKEKEKNKQERKGKYGDRIRREKDKYGDRCRMGNAIRGLW